jgi:hypothetical protein
MGRIADIKARPHATLLLMSPGCTPCERALQSLPQLQVSCLEVVDIADVLGEIAEIDRPSVPLMIEYANGTERRRAAGIEQILSVFGRGKNS